MKAKGKPEMNWNQFFTVRPCDDAVAWLDEGGFASLDEAWPVCPHGDHLVWAACHRNDGHALNKQQRVEIAVRLVRETPLGDGRTVYDLLEDERSLEAIAVAERFVVGEATEEELRIAADAADAAYAAYAAFSAADAAFAAYAAFSAAFAAYAADAADAAAYAAAYAARAAAANAAADAAYAATRAAAQKVQADIVREWWPTWTPSNSADVVGWRESKE